MIKLKLNIFNTYENENNKALDSAVYGIKIGKINSGKSKLLYIGQSNDPIIRCGEHLNKLKYTEDYLGLTQDLLENKELELTFTILENILFIKKETGAKKHELAWIKKLSPILQNGINDHIYPRDIQVKKVKEIIDELS